ncbi:MAG: L-threonylcarbamoyladenylate synthase [Polyangiaceae bacterium]|nr:L-threonylcarbamoyladenylate synthase [Polyangiaceae bacterium]
MSAAFDAALDVLAAGGVVAAATETLFGLLADARSSEAVARVAALKPRDDKAFPLILSSRESWSAFAPDVPEVAAALATAFWPGPLTIAVPARPGLDPRLVSAGTVAVRLPAPSPAARLAARFGGALTATSANPSGLPPSADPATVRGYFADAIAAGALFVLDEPAPGGPPSTVVVVTGSKVEIVREGAISAERVLGAVGRAR